ncbi:MAG: hypothetical protein HC941_19555 [Microcoleus sp. SU_5_3]|nr:hypothetical protein [Microcoleus sp. SU_5_3]
MWQKPIALIILTLVVCIVGAIAIGTYRWHLGNDPKNDSKIGPRATNSTQLGRGLVDRVIEKGGGCFRAIGYDEIVADPAILGQP